MSKLTPFGNGNKILGYIYPCPGCGDIHVIFVSPNKSPNGSSWNFNDSMDKPTFEPSVLSKIQWNEQGKKELVCHSFVTDGKIRFLSDSNHELAGKTVDMIDIPENQNEQDRKS